MTLFWIVAAVLSAAAVLVVLACARRAEASPPVDPEAAVHARQLAELEDLRARGLLDADAYAAARAEAARRLLRAEADAPAPVTARPADRKLAFGGACAAVIGALGVYVFAGSPGYADQPYVGRLAAWSKADPATLEPAEAAAVLTEVARARPQDPQAWAFLGRARAESGDYFGAARAFEEALRLRPDDPSDWGALGEVLVRLAEGRVGPDAERAFRRSLTLDPASPAALWWLGKAAADEGRTADALARWRPLYEGLDPRDPRRAAVAAEIARLEGRPPPSPLDDASPEERAAITGMVENLAARLRDQPRDPEGWARLVRAYTVLGRTAARDAALADARRALADNPAAVASVEAAAK